MRTYNVSLPQKSRVTGLLVSYVLIAILSFGGGISSINNNHNLGLFFFKIFAGDNFALFIALIAFKKYWSVFKVIELHNDRMIIQGDEPEIFFFKDIFDYKYGSNRGVTTIAFKLNDGKQFSLGSGLRNENLIFIEALNEEIAQLIAACDLQLSKKLYAPFLGSKWMLVVMVCYSISLYAFSQYFKNIANFKLVMVISCFIAFIGWVAYFTIKVTNNTNDWYQRE